MKKTIIFLLMLIISAIGIFYFYKEISMEIGPKEAARLRDELHNLNIRNFADREIYYEKLYYIIASGEGFSSKPYRDSRGLLTIGYGFNMDRGDASRNEWDEIFKGSLSFYDAKSGKIGITKEQARMLKRYGVEKRENELAKIYDPYWDKMRLNEKAILTDLYYQRPSLAGGNSRLSKHIKDYYETNNVAYFELAVTEVQLNSSYSKNPLERIGLQNRNNIRAIILDSRSCPLYSRPHDELIPENKQIEVILGETIIPREVSAKFPESNNLGDYYIWRTCLDDKVRDAHKEFEGKVFKHEDDIKHPQEDYRCRCYKQRLPIHAKIIEKEEPKPELREEDFSGEIIRKHLANLYEIPGFYIR
jgi:GH24 family phage-related lysozyme (muramidase)